MTPRKPYNMVCDTFLRDRKNYKYILVSVYNIYLLRPDFVMFLHVSLTTKHDKNKHQS